MPEPDRPIVVGEFVALLVTVTLPVTPPTDAGAKSTFNVVLCPGARICPVDTPLALKPGPAMLTFETVTLEFPELVSVIEAPLFPPTLMLPKLTLGGWPPKQVKWR